jgi:hypothetical protein
MSLTDVTEWLRQQGYGQLAIAAVLNSIREARRLFAAPGDEEKRKAMEKSPISAVAPTNDEVDHDD